MSLLGNQLDRLLRQSQEQQSVGIPIGPDSSLVIAEIVLSAVDTVLHNRIPGLNGLRYMDEYELVFPDRSGAELGLAALQETLLDFQLRLNPRKTSIEQAPVELEREWVHEFLRFKFSRNSKFQTKDLLHYFDLIGRYSCLFPQDPVSSYALARLRREPIARSNSGLFQSLLAEVVTTEPSSVRYYFEVLARCKSRGHAIDLQLTEMTLNHIIHASTPFGGTTRLHGHSGRC